jgi:hypothetical protein
MPFTLMKSAITRGRYVWYMPVGKHVCSVMLLSLITFPCLSQNIGNWTFNTTLTGTGGTNNTVSTADFSASIPSKVFHGSGEYYGENGWPSGALDPAAYIQFTISPNTGYQLDLTSVMLSIRRSTTGASGSGPTSWTLRSSLDGYTANLGSNSLTSSYGNFTVTLGSSFLNVYTPVSFRIYGFNTIVSGGGGLSRLVFDNISIQGIGEVLPVSITGVQALHNDDKNVSVKWQVTNVHEGSVFNVERSTNGSDFTTINRFRERETKSTGSYSFEDNQSPGNASAVYYRIKINEPTGWTYFSWLVKVDNKTTRQLLIDYTTIQGQLLVTSLQVPEKGRYTVSVLAMNGAVLQQRALDLEAGVHVFSFPLDALAHGTYVVRVGNNKSFSSKKFVW